VVIYLERCADLYLAQLMPLPLTVSCFSKIQIGFAFLVPAHLGSPGKEPLNGCVCMCVCAGYTTTTETEMTTCVTIETGLICAYIHHNNIKGGSGT